MPTEYEMTGNKAEMGDSEEDIRRKIHDSLDLVERCLQPIPTPDSSSPNAIDVLIQLRHAINAQLGPHGPSSS
jgi:hypothetical protein